MKALSKGAGVFQEVSGVLVRHSGTSVGTGADQEISHGFASAPRRLETGPLDTDDAAIVFSGRSVEATHFHITATNGLHFFWIAESWE